MNFHIIIRNRVAEVLSDGGRLPLLVCGNTDNRILFSFDEEWDVNAVKTARFIYRPNGGEGNLIYRDVAFIGNSVPVPLLRNVTEVWVGVLSDQGMTSSAARIACVSAITGFSIEENEVETESVRVALDLADGNQIITTTSGRPMSTVTVEKPETLTPENIREGVVIAGIVGTCTPMVEALVAPNIFLEGSELLIVPIAGSAEFYDILWSEEGEGFNLKDTVEAEEGAMRVDLTPYLQDGENYFRVRARNETTGEEAITLAYVQYTKLSGLTAPTITLSGSKLTIVAGEGDVDLYEIMRGTDTGGFATVETIRIENNETVTLSLAPYIALGNNYFNVCAQNLTTGESAMTADSLSYYLSELTAPQISLSGTTLVITPTAGLATKYAILTSEDGEGYSTVATVSATDSTVTVDISSYLVYERTYFTVRAVNEWTGETATTLTNPCYPPNESFKLTLFDAQSECSFRVLKGGSGDILMAGHYDAVISSGGSMSALTSIDTVYVTANYEGNYYIPRAEGEGCTVSRKTKFIEIKNITQDASVTIYVTYL